MELWDERRNHKTETILHDKKKTGEIPKPKQTEQDTK